MKKKKDHLIRHKKGKKIQEQNTHPQRRQVPKIYPARKTPESKHEILEL